MIFPEGRITFFGEVCFLAKSVLRFGAESDFGIPTVATAAYTVRHGLVPGRLPKTHEQRVPTLCSAPDAASKTCAALPCARRTVLATLRTGVGNG